LGTSKKAPTVLTVGAFFMTCNVQKIWG